MTCQYNNYELILNCGAISAAPAGCCTHIKCVNGSVWITLDNDPRDIVLEEGEIFNTAKHKRVLIYAFQSSRVLVTSSKSILLKSSLHIFKRSKARLHSILKASHD